MTAPQVPPVDPGNQLLAEVPAQLMTALVASPQGQRLALTIRTASTTLTVMLAGPDARNWAQMLAKTAESMSVAGLIIANGNLP
jgi:hypothetical protein